MTSLRNPCFLSALVIAMFAGWVHAQAPTLESRWDDLGSSKESQATRAMLGLAATPKETIAFLKDHLKPVKADAMRIAELVKKMQAGNFTARSKAMAELEYLGKYAKADLEALAKGDVDVETKARIQQLIDKMPKEQKAPPPMPFKARPGSSISVSNINGEIRIAIDGVPLDFSKMATPPTPPPGPPQSWIRAVRGVTLLEHLSTPDALQILEGLAGGEPDALPTIAAKEALGRLKK